MMGRTTHRRSQTRGETRGEVQRDGCDAERG